MSEEIEKYRPVSKPDEVWGAGVEAGDFEDRGITPLEKEKRIHFADGSQIDTAGATQISYIKRKENFLDASDTREDYMEDLLYITVIFPDKKPLTVKVSEDGQVMTADYEAEVKGFNSTADPGFEK